MPRPSPRPVVELAAPMGLRPALGALLDLAGWRTSHPTRPPEVGLVVLSTPEPPERWTREGLPHLALGLGAATARVGPFVVPGLTACVRCVQSHDPLLSTDAASAGRLPLLSVAVGWALLDLRTWLAGRTPATWDGATLTLDEHHVVRRHVWPRHPHCGCSWGLAAG